MIAKPAALTKQQQAALEAVARHVSAQWETGESPSTASIVLAGRRIALDVATMRPAIANLQKPRLRFDKVVLRLMSRLQDALREAIPDGTTVLLTVTAPIRLPAQTAAALEDLIRACLARRAAHCADTIHGNQIRLRLLPGLPQQAPKLIGFVHNPETDPETLLDLTQSLLRPIAAAAARRAPPGSAAERWLILAMEGASAPVETWRQIYTQLNILTDFTEILLAFADGRVESLTPRRL